MTREERLQSFPKDSVQRLYRPVLYEETVPAEPMALTDGSYEAEWWTDQFIRCKFGWVAPDGNFINPIYYFYLNFVSIDIKPEGVVVTEPPLYVDTDQEIFDIIYLHQYEQGSSIYAKNVVLAKGRRKHWSENTHCGVLLWDFVMGWGNVAICYPQEDPFLIEGKQRFTNAYNSLHEFWKADVLTSIKNKLGFGIKEVNTETGEATVRNRNTIIFSPMDKKFDRFRGLNFWRVLIDEAGIYRNLIQIYGATKDCCKEGSFKFGQILIGGTSDAIENKSSDYRDMYFNPRGYDAVTWFIPCYKCSPPDIDWNTGRSLVEQSKPKYEAERQKIRGNSELLHKEKQENPMNPKECFLPPSTSSYPGYKIDGQAHYVLDNMLDHSIIKGRLEFEGGGRSVVFIPDEQGMWSVYKNGHPVAGLKNLHVLGIDDVYAEEKKDAPFSDSQCAIVVYRELDHRVKESDLPVAVFEGRPSRTTFRNEILKAIRYWDAMAVVENNDEVVVQFLIKKDAADKIMHFNGKPGIKGAESSWIGKMTSICDEWFNEDRHQRVYFLSILQALGLWRQQNTDIGSAFHLALLGVDQRKGIGVERTNSEVKEVKRLVAGKIGRKEQLGLGPGKEKKWFNRTNRTR